MTATRRPAPVRSAHAELIRTSGASRLWIALIPTAVLLPVVITLGIAAIAERFARIPGQISVLAVSTSNSAYWVITITVVLVAVAAADGQAADGRYRTGDYVRLAISRRAPVLLGRWMFYGTLGVIVSVVALVVVVVALPAVAPTVYGTVSLTDAVGVRLLWTVPVYAFFAAAAGVGVGALIPTPVGSTAAVLLWAFVAETAAGYLPHGASLQRYLPVFNAVYATGQDIALQPPWSPNGALLYASALFTAPLTVAVLMRRN
ncbi:ABC transporter permease [Mycolicibacterium duvalii]|uniref:ABC transporter n=1 Tax=Mycolicibacterium duvalii TaxID=39688 RepID=A0A7I7JVN6_9MYCO|nr:ABC transporter permease [Mycolicibacterium duvalii]MCV7369984.1 ABC transporter permease [Mycolicibacterium duvalii]PEG34861.1 ABC transporter permease [Mycolicibacterium duvalii]BBX15915.1 ABC transporter [Mycolicibacterium duvalii]